MLTCNGSTVMTSITQITVHWAQIKCSLFPSQIHTPGWGWTLGCSKTKVMAWFFTGWEKSSLYEGLRTLVIPVLLSPACLWVLQDWPCLGGGRVPERTWRHVAGGHWACPGPGCRSACRDDGETPEVEDVLLLWWRSTGPRMTRQFGSLRFDKT